LIKVADDLYFQEAKLNAAKDILVNHLQVTSALTISDARDLLGSSRKYILPLLEYFDREKITRRSGDKRILY
jgi:selenocysteine-specific elongation factor